MVQQQPQMGMSQWQAELTQRSLSDRMQNDYLWARMNLVDVPGTELQKDQLAFQYAQLESQNAMGAMNLSAQLRGPRNAFKQQEVNYGLNQAGLSRAVDAVAGKYAVPGFQAPRANPEAASLASHIGDMLGAGGAPTKTNKRGQQVYNPSATPVPFNKDYGPGWTPPNLNAPKKKGGPAQEPLAVAPGADPRYPYPVGAGSKTPITVSVTDRLNVPEWVDMDGQYGETTRYYNNQPQTTSQTFAGQGNSRRAQNYLKGFTRAKAFRAPVAEVVVPTAASPTLGELYANLQGGPTQAQAWNRAHGLTPDGQTPLAAGQQGFETLRVGQLGTGAGASFAATGHHRAPNDGNLQGKVRKANRFAGTRGQAKLQAQHLGAVPMANSQAIQRAYLQALPNPNRISGRNWVDLAPDAREFMLGAYEQMGYSANDVLAQIQRGLPGFRAPAVGAVAF